jgi:DNA mismatch repair protein MutL
VIEKTRSEARIRVLDVSVANKIAAGEVVERPASVVKELVENALDGHATRLDVWVEQGGRRLVRVVDDGWGIAQADLELAFRPHATSKLADVGDLESIATLGFRGEALASIGAVAQAKILSRVHGAESGFAVENRGGEISEARAAGAAPGTDVSVRNLFFNTPVRARFLRSVRTELGHIEDLVRRFALAFPEVGFRLLHDGAELVRTAPEESQRGRLGSLYGRELAAQLLEVRADVGLGSVEAYLAPPSVSRPNARELHFFVNGRFVRDKILHRVVRDVYRDAMHGGRYPVVFLFLEIDPAAVDVNVHPTKAEVRWREPRFLHAAVAPALRKALRDADLAVGAERPPAERGHEAGVRDAMADFMRRAGRMGDQEPRIFERQAGAPARVFQVHESYLVCETDDGIAIIDQHALHERVQYDRILKRLAEGGVETQRLLVPEEVELAAEDLGVLSEHADLLARCGLAWSPFGDRSIALETLPVVIPRAKAAELVRDILELLRARGSDIDARTLFHDVTVSAATRPPP